MDPPATIGCAALAGVDAIPVTLEATIRSPQATPRLLGSVGTIAREAFHRVQSALQATGVPLPPGSPVLNFHPAAVPKTGAGFDLPMLLVLLAAHHILPRPRVAALCAHGEVALSGSVLPARGVVAVALAARRDGREQLLCSRRDAPLAALVPGLEVFGVDTLNEALTWLSGHHTLEPTRPRPVPAPVDTADLLDIRGHHTPKTALTVAAAGRHNLLFVGPPGSGKSALLRRLPGLLPDLGPEQALEIVKIHSVTRTEPEQVGALLCCRPFRCPHHTSTTPSILGGGSDPRPGEVTLAHGGTLFLDELPEFRRETLEALRQPLEDGRVVVGRSLRTVTMPADFQLVAAMNPCPCGFAGHQHRPCTCPPSQVQRYRGRLSGPLLDRIDLQVEVPALDPAEFRTAPESSWGTAALRERVLQAVERQRHRNGPTLANGRLVDQALLRAARPNQAVLDTLDGLLRRQRLSGRARVRLLRIARTLADLDDRQELDEGDILEAARLRGFARHGGG